MKYKAPRTSIIVHEDGYHITYNREDGYAAYIDDPYFSAVCLGYRTSQTEAQTLINTYRMENANAQTQAATSRQEA